MESSNEWQDQVLCQDQKLALGIDVDPWKDSNTSMDHTSPVNVPASTEVQTDMSSSAPIHSQLDELSISEFSQSAPVRQSSTESLSRKKPVSKSQTLSSIQNVFTDAQKIAYVSLCYLIRANFKNRRLKGLKKALASYDQWSGQFMEKLYVYLDILVEGFFINPERQMVQTLAEHGLQEEDIVKGLMRDVSSQMEAYKATVDNGLENNNRISDIRFTILSHLFIICISDGFFDARARTVLKAVASHLSIPALELVNLENIISDQLRVSDHADEVRHEGEIVENRNKLEATNRWLFAGLATVAGGAVIGLTAGLAAPFIGAGIVSALTTFGVTGAGVTGVGTFMASAGGLAMITTGGVLTGGGYFY